MLKKINDFLSGLPMTIVAGVFLLLDLVPHLMEEFGGTPVRLSFLPFDPAWVTVVISGIPLLYLAVWRIIHNPGISKISSALLICIAMFAAIASGICSLRVKSYLSWQSARCWRKPLPTAPKRA